MGAGVLEKHSSHKSVSVVSHCSKGSDAVRVRNVCHSSTKPRVSTGCLLKLLFFDTQPIVVHGLGHG